MIPQKASLWIFGALVILLNLYMFLEYLLPPPIDLLLLIYALRFALNIAAVMMSLITWRSGQRVFIPLATALYTLSIVSNLAAMVLFVLSDLSSLRWNIIVSAVLLLAAIFLLVQCFFKTTPAFFRAMPVIIRFIIIAGLVAASLATGYMYPDMTAWYFLFQTLSLLAMATPAFILLLRTAKAAAAVISTDLDS